MCKSISENYKEPDIMPLEVLVIKSYLCKQTDQTCEAFISCNKCNKFCEEIVNINAALCFYGALRMFVQLWMCNIS